MWNKCLLTIAILCNATAFAEVLIQGMGTPPIEYQAALHLDPKAESYVDWQKNSLLKEAPVYELRRLYTAAMASYLQGSLVEAQKAFEKVADLRHQYHWSESARFLIFTACLRRAQIETKSYVKQSWLNVSLEIGWDLQPDAKIFPPPFIQEWQQLKEQLQWISPHPLMADPYFGGVLISGRFYNLKNSIAKIPRLRARISFLSNQKQLITLVTSTDQILKPIDWKDWISSQKCPEQKNWDSTSYPSGKFKVVWSSACKKNLDLSITQAPRAFSTSQTDYDKAKVSNNWIWWSLGAAAVAYVIYSQNKQQERAGGSSSTYGF